MQENKRVLLGILALAAFVLIVIVLPGFMNQTNPTQCFMDGVCLHEERLNFIINLTPLIFGLGFAICAAALYFFIETRKVERIEVKIPREELVKMLPSDERAIVSYILEEGGRVLQSEVSRVGGMGKVKAHRVLERLEKRNVVEKESHGKTRLVKLSKEFRKLAELTE